MNSQSLTILVIDANAAQRQYAQFEIEKAGHQAIGIDNANKINFIEARVDLVIIAPTHQQQLRTTNRLIPDAPLALAGVSRQSLNGDAGLVAHSLTYPYQPSELIGLFDRISAEVGAESFDGISALLAELVSNPNRAGSLNSLAQWIVKNFKTYAAVTIHLVEEGTLRCRVFETDTPEAMPKSTLHGSFEDDLLSPLLKPDARQANVFEIADMRKRSEPLAASMAEAGYRSMLAVPMMIRKDVIGVLSCYALNPLAFSERHKQTMATFAHVAALEIYNERQSSERELLNEVSAQWQQATNRTTALNIIIENVQPIARAQGAAVCLYSADSERYAYTGYKRESGLGIDIIDWEQSTDEWRDLHNYIFEKKELLVNNINQRNRFPAIQKIFVDTGIRSFIALPLFHDDLRMGMLFVFYSRQHPYTIDDRDAYEQRDGLDLFRRQASVAVGRAYEQERYQRSMDAILSWNKETHNGLPLTGATSEFWEKYIKSTMLNQDIGADRGAIVVLKGSSKGIYTVNLSEDYVGAQFTLDDTLEMWVCSHMSYGLVENVKRESQSGDYCVYVDSDEVKGRWGMAISAEITPPKSKLVVPIRYQDQLLGLLILESSLHTLNRFDAIHFEQIAHSIGLTLHVDNPTSDLMQDAEQLPALQPIRQEIENISNRLLAELKADLVTVLIYSPYWDSIQIPITSGRMDSVVLPYTKKQLLNLLWNEEPHTLLTDESALRLITDDFCDRESIQTIRAICFRNDDDLPIGAILVHWRKEHKVSAKEALLLQIRTQDVRHRVVRNYRFSQAAAKLQERLKFDLVRLHMFKQDRPGKLRGDQRALRWAQRPVSKGSLLVKQGWTKRKTAGPIATILKNYLENDGDHYAFVDNMTTTDMATLGTFTRREKIKSGAYVLLIVNRGEEDEEIVGVLFVNWRATHNWTQAEKRAVLFFAQQMALAIYNRRMMTMLKERGISENWVQELMGKIIHNRLSRQKALELIIETACSITDAHFGDIRLIDGDNLVVEAITGEPEVKALYQSKYRSLAIDGKSLTCRTFRIGKAQIFANVLEEPDYISADSTTRSEIVALIRHVESGENIGSINLEHKSREGFNQDHKQRLISICEVIAIILQHIDQYAHLEQDQQLLYLFEQVASAGIIGKNWEHSAQQKYFSIRALIEAIHIHVDKKRVPKQSIHNLLDNINRQIIDVSTIPEHNALARSTLEAVEPIVLDDVLQSHVESLCVDCATPLQFDLNCGDRLVAIDHGAFCAAVENLVQNSLRAIQHLGKDGRLLICTRITHAGAEILIEDNGPGISAEVRRFYLRALIPEHLRSGTGEGAILAMFLLRSYKSTLTYDPNPENGGAMHRIVIPFA